eukprot:UN11044
MCWVVSRTCERLSESKRNLLLICSRCHNSLCKVRKHEHISLSALHHKKYLK